MNPQSKGRNLPDLGAKSSLEGRAAGSIEERLARAAEGAQESLMLVQDHSGSMDEVLADGAVKLDAAKQAVSSFLDACDRRISAIGLVAFESRARLLSPLIQHYPSVRSKMLSLASDGGTNMAEGMFLGLSQNLTRMILVSDGIANSPALAITQAHHARSRNVPIDCIYIGSGNDIGAKLLRDIAELTRGYFFNATDVKTYIKSLAKLEFRARLQLEDRR